MSEGASSLVITNLSKSYRVGFLGRRRWTALDDFSLDVKAGEVFGLLGPNGSGKTTTLKLILGLIAADGGRITVLGRPHADPAWREAVSFLPEQPYFYDYLTATEYLDYVGRLHGLARRVSRPRSAELVERLGLSRSAHVALRRYSKGMTQRLGIAQALMNDPRLVFLDEPMSGLDPIGRRLVRDVILELKRAGKTVFFSTHILSDAEALCDRVALLRAGRLVRVGRLDEILRMDVAHVEVLVAGLTPGALDGLETRPRAAVAMGDRHRLEVDETALGPLLSELTARGARILSVQPVRQSLEDFFLAEVAAKQGAGWALDD